MRKMVNYGHLFPSVCHNSADLIKKKTFCYHDSSCAANHHNVMNVGWPLAHQTLDCKESKQMFNWVYADMLSNTLKTI